MRFIDGDHNLPMVYAISSNYDMERSPLSPTEDQLAWKRRIISISLDGLSGEEHMHNIFLTHPSLRHAFNCMALIDHLVRYPLCYSTRRFATSVAYTLKHFSPTMIVGCDSDFCNTTMDAPSPVWTMINKIIEGNELAAYGMLETYHLDGTRDSLPGASLMGTER